MKTFVVFGIYVLLCCYYMRVYSNAVYNNDYRKMKHIIVILAITAILIGGLRSFNVGSGDVGSYKYRFEVWQQQLSLKELIRISFDKWSTDGSYYVAAKIFSQIVPDFQAWMCALCILFIAVCAVAIRKWSENPPVSFVYLMLMGIYIFTWMGMKQCIAMSLCMIAFFAMQKKKYISFVLLIIIAFTFHNSAIIFLLVLVASKMRVKFWNFGLIAGSLLLTMITPTTIRTILSTTFSNIEGIAGYAVSTKAYSYSVFFVMLLLYFVFFCFREDLISENKINQLFLNMSLIGVCLQAMASVIAEFFRAAYYFSIFNMLLMGNLVAIGVKKYPKLHIPELSIIFMVIYFIWTGGISYSFFWN